MYHYIMDVLKYCVGNVLNEFLIYSRWKFTHNFNQPLALLFRKKILVHHYNCSFLSFSLSVDKKPKICFLSLYTCSLFLEFYINGIMQYVFSFQLLSHSLIILRFIHVVAYINFIPFHCWLVFHSMFIAICL
jgi:hypothetical protein